MTPRPRYVLTLEPQPSDVPPMIRLRRALKYLGRVQGLLCVDCRELKPDELAPPKEEPRA